MRKIAEGIDLCVTDEPLWSVDRGSRSEEGSGSVEGGPRSEDRGSRSEDRE